jgi:hypothetical protein
MDQEVFRKLYDETNRVHQIARTENPFFIVGRKGAGKTAFLLGAAFSEQADVVLIKSEDVYTEVNKLCARYEERNGPVVADALVHVWEVLLYHAAMLQIVRSKRIENSPALQSLWSYVCVFGEPTDIEPDSLVASVGALITEKLVADSLGQSFREACWSIDPGRGSSAEAAKWTKEILQEAAPTTVYVVVDNLEDLHKKLNEFADVVTALFRLVSRSVAGRRELRMPFRIRFAFPAELRPRLRELAANPEKDFRKPLTIRWTASELIVLVGHRLRTFLDLYFPTAPKELGLPREHDPADRQAAKKTLRAVLPEKIINGLGAEEDPVAYLMRHTQLLPRHLIIILNEIMSSAVRGLKTGDLPQANADQVVDGVDKAESLIVDGILTSYMYEYPKVGDALDMIKNHVNVVEPVSNLHKVFNKASVARAGLSFDEFVDACLAVGALGVVNEDDPHGRYVQGEFSYTFVGEVLRPVEDRDEVCVHPLFVSRLFGRHRIQELVRDRTRAVYRTVRTPSTMPMKSTHSEGGSELPASSTGRHYTRLGISLSGGGIRSATFSLGVCQKLIDEGILERARYLSAVSGGSYLASGLAISNALCPDELREEEPRPWARGSPEEERLRGNLSYLAPGGRGRLWLFANLLYGMALNLTPLVLSAYLCGNAVGLWLRSLYPGLGISSDPTMSRITGVLVVVVVLIGAAVGVVGWRRFLDKDDKRRRLEKAKSEDRVALFLLLAAAVVLLNVILPGILYGLGELTGGQVTAGLGLGELNLALSRLILGVLIVALSLGLGGTAVWLLRRRKMTRLRGALAYLSGIGILFAPFLLGAQTAVVRGWSLSADGAIWGAAITVILLFAILVHNRRYSMHLFYRERIQQAFASRRVRKKGKLDVDPIAYTESIKLSDIAERNAERSANGGPPFPELVMCAAVAARGAEVPNKTWAASFTFERKRSGNKRIGVDTDTTKVEEGDWIGGGGLTLPAMMAISGAAVSPLMGRFTVPAFRFLMAMMNIRLGVWIPNPAFDGKEPVDPGDEDPPWHLWLWRYIVRGWREPGALYVLKEGLGLVDLEGRYIYVSDGGHWENLGLTELLRRRCTHIVVVDASGSPGLGDIARAMAIARAELGIEFELDPRVAVTKEDGLAEAPVAVGRFRYPEGHTGNIFYARSVLWPDAPSHLHLFAHREDRFPNHPTSNQFSPGTFSMLTAPSVGPSARV